MIAASLNADLIDRNSLEQRPEDEGDPNMNLVAVKDIMKLPEGTVVGVLDSQT